ncbi:MAG TPA: protease inhibitor I42 family protein [Coriobacteriia bacterium]|nr:protease inhibitor I42 family protein [Coriobacteriia bacterium]
MRIRWIALGAVAVAVALVGACSTSRAMVDEGDNGNSVRVGIGQVLEVRVPSNPSTGYSWQVVDVPDFLAFDETVEFESDAGPDVVGAGGTEVLKFTVEGDGTGTLRLEYLRPWEADTPAIEVYEIEVTAR